MNTETTTSYMAVKSQLASCFRVMAALIAIVGLALRYGAVQPLATMTTIQVVLCAALCVFTAAELLQYRYDKATYRLGLGVIIIAVVIWGIVGGSSASAIRLLLAGGFVVVAINAIIGIRCIERALTSDHSTGATIRWALSTAILIALISGAILSLPICWNGPHPLDHETTFTSRTAYDLAMHGLNCLFTATASLTGTGLTSHKLSYDFTRVGQTVILCLMQLGGLAIVALGTIVGWRIRLMAGWQSREDAASPPALRRLLAFSLTLLLLIELVGFVALTASPMAESYPSWCDRCFEAGFLAVSATCNVGLTLSDNSLIGTSHFLPVYAFILPLMILGGIGGPVAYDCYRRLLGRVGQLGRDTIITLIGTIALIVVSAGVLYTIESTTRYQERYYRSDALERIQTASPPSSDSIVFSAEDSERTQSERLRTMSPGQRVGASLFQSASARTAGIQTVRLDTDPKAKSISPASRLVLMANMIIGGGMGSTSGGLRITVVALLLGFCLSPRRDDDQIRASRRKVLLPIVKAAMALMLIIGATTFVLSFRQSASFEGCLFEAVSSSCNVGFTSGITSNLVNEDRLTGPIALRVMSRITLILAMLLGRILPIAILLRHLQPTGRPRQVPIYEREKQTNDPA